MLCRSLICWISAAPLAVAAVSISLDEGAVRVSPAADCGRLTVSVDRPDAPALAGACRREGDGLLFAPRYPFAPDVAYRVQYAADFAVVRAKVAASAGTLVEKIFPSGDAWPENQLRFYVHFSAPMSRGEAFQRLHLIDLTSETEVRLPFLEIHEELWDREQKRLTVLFDPGRVKRGLVPHNEVGPPLVAGRRYRLVIDSAWRDAAHQPLRAGFTREFAATVAVREGVEPTAWIITPPKAGSRNALALQFPRPLDAGLALSCLSVEGVAGQANLESDESRWTFVPDQPWAPGEHRLQIAGMIEDGAGNRLGRAFDVDLDVFDQVKTTPAPPRSLPFVAR